MQRLPGGAVSACLVIFSAALALPFPRGMRLLLVSIVLSVLVLWALACGGGVSLK
jgi:hypothetical protein